MNVVKNSDIKALIGLGNPGSRFEKTRHNIGFRILDLLADRYGARWQSKDEMEIAHIHTGAGKSLILIKPQTFMNTSGRVIPFLLKQGIKAEHILVVHDELEKPFGALSFKTGGSHRGHNGLRSIIEVCGAEFMRLRFGIGRPENKAEVGDYVLKTFSENASDVDALIEKSVGMIDTLINS